MIVALVVAAAGLLAAWAALEIVVRLYVGMPLRVDFYGSIPRGAVRERQERFGVRVAMGLGWAHLGWIAAPDMERYRVERWREGMWQAVATVRFGSFLLREGGMYRIVALASSGGCERVIGEVETSMRPRTAPLCVPRIAGPWQTLFRPLRSGDYINDHTVYQDAQRRWRLIGITAKGSGDYAAERSFATAMSTEFPPASAMQEDAPLADFDELAWAPHVIEEADTYYVFWSPHRLHRMTSADGVEWGEHRVVMERPFHKFFRDATILKVADGQWLLYCTARGRYFSRVDLYQSFDLEGWQYIGPALRTGLGSERNAIVASTESPAVVDYRDRFYLALTYNNDSFFWPAILLALKIWRGRDSYNDTLVLHSDNPYDFGIYRGRTRSPTLVTRLRAHAAELVHQPQQDRWYITTAGWPWVATLTSGEVAVAPLDWDAPVATAPNPQPPRLHAPPPARSSGPARRAPRRATVMSRTWEG